MQLIGGLMFTDNSNTLIHLMVLPLLDNFEEASGYSWVGVYLAWLYSELCQASNAPTLEISDH